jgi:predicted phage-related endonuclease
MGETNKEDILRRIIKANALEVSIENVSKLSKDDYALSRKKTFGASDSSVLLGVNPYADITALLNEKAADIVTDDERAIGEKAVVKKGFELEDFVVEKAKDEFFNGREIIKPPHSYVFKEFPFLSVNFDGVILDEPLIKYFEVPDLADEEMKKMMEKEQLVPVEIKVVNTYAFKSWNISINNAERLEIDMRPRSTHIQKHV